MSDGEMTIDHYTLINCVASGNATQIWEVTEQGGGQSYAMKLLLPEATKDLAEIKVIKQEAKIGKVMDHPNLMKVHFSVVNKQHGYLIMDYFRAPNVKTQIHNDLLSLQVRIRKLVESTALGLGFMHDKGWIHRDVKPDNILFNKGGELRVIDYSLSCRKKKKDKEIRGTKSYIAPETLLRKPMTAQTDMYGFGVTLYFVLTGELPITGMTPAELLKNHIRLQPQPPSGSNKNVTPEMDAFVLKLLAKKPKDRFESMAELHAEFRNINVFHEDVERLDAERKKAEEIENRDGIDAATRLDSRRDVERQELLARDGVAPPSRKKSAPPNKAAAPKPQAPKPVAQQPPPQQPAAPMPQQPVAMHQQPYPMQPMPQQPYGVPPASPMPQQPMMQQPVVMQQPMMQPQMPQQPFPQTSPGVVPQPAAAPPQAVPQPVQQPPAAQVPPQPAPPAPAAPQPSVGSEEELGFMDELPDVI